MTNHWAEVDQFWPGILQIGLWTNIGQARTAIGQHFPKSTKLDPLVLLSVLCRLRVARGAGEMRRWLRSGGLVQSDLAASTEAKAGDLVVAVDLLGPGEWVAGPVAQCYDQLPLALLEEVAIRAGA